MDLLPKANSSNMDQSFRCSITKGELDHRTKHHPERTITQPSIIPNSVRPPLSSYMHKQQHQATVLSLSMMGVLTPRMLSLDRGYVADQVDDTSAATKKE